MFLATPILSLASLTMKRITPLIAALVCSASLAHSQTLLNINFQADQAGQAPSSGTISGIEQGRIIVVDSSTNPASPFGTGKKGLFIEKVSRGAVPTIRWNFSATTVGEVEASVLAPSPSDGFTTSGAIYLFKGATLGVGVIWNATGKLSIMGRSSEGGENVVIGFADPIPFDVVIDVKLTFRDGAVSVLVNNVLQESDSGQTEFFMRLSDGGVDNIAFADPSTTNENRFFFVESFEVKAIPEPSTAGLLGVAGVTGIFLSRRFIWSPRTQAGK